jgi:hypothetical protein
MRDSMIRYDFRPYDPSSRATPPEGADRSGIVNGGFGTNGAGEDG